MCFWAFPEVAKSAFLGRFLRFGVARCFGLFTWATVKLLSMQRPSLVVFSETELPAYAVLEIRGYGKGRGHYTPAFTRLYLTRLLAFFEDEGDSHVHLVGSDLVVLDQDFHVLYPGARRCAGCWSHARPPG